MSYAQLIKALRYGDMTLYELAEETGLHYLTVALYTRELYQAKQIHIARWENDTLGRSAVKIYKLGPGKDAPRRVLTPAQRQQTRRDRVKAIEMIQRMAGGIHVGST